LATTTTRLGLTKPAGTDLVDITVLNSNFDKTDAAAGAFVCTSATRPGTPYSGQIIYETDTKRSYVWDSGTSSWLILVPGSTVCTSASRPAGPVAGQVIYETDTKRTYVYTGSVWAAVVNDTALTQFSPVIVASAAARDALIASPTQGQRVFRTDLQAEEVYYGAYNASTNVAGAATAGWYPAPGTTFFYSTATRTTAAGSTYLMGETGFSMTERRDVLAWHDASTNPTRVTPTIAGIYQFSTNAVWSGSVTVHRIRAYINGTARSATSVATGLADGAANTMVTQMNGSTDYYTVDFYNDSGTPTITSYLAVTYLGPANS